MAYPDGRLVDLKPKLTDCSLINNTIRGLEYAKNACQNSNYPYLFWSGSIEAEELLNDKGWVVAKKDLEFFLTDKLSYMGFYKNEIADFMEYWLPYFEGKNYPYYKLSFFQTQKLDQLFPLSVVLNQIQC